MSAKTFSLSVISCNRDKAGESETVGQVSTFSCDVPFAATHASFPAEPQRHYRASGL
jgi:hypothetical protein